MYANSGVHIYIYVWQCSHLWICTCIAQSAICARSVEKSVPQCDPPCVFGRFLLEVSGSVFLWGVYIYMRISLVACLGVHLRLLLVSALQFVTSGELALTLATAQRCCLASSATAFTLTVRACGQRHE